MAGKDLQYTVGVDTGDAKRGLRELQSNVEGVTQTFGRMKQAIAGIAVGSFIQNIFGLSSAISDMSAATGLSIQTITGLTQALINNGSTVDRARDGISDFVKNLGEARRGSTELQRSFALAGVSLNDLATLSEQDLLRKTINGLASVSDNATRSSVSMRIFGESTKGVDLRGVNQDLDAFIARSGGTANAIAKAAEVSRRFNTAFFELKLTVLEALEPLAGLAESITRNREAISRLIRALVEIGTAFAIVKGVTKLTTGLDQLLKITMRNTSSLRTFGTALRSLASVEGARSAIRNIRRELIELPNIFRGTARETTGLKNKLGALLNSFAFMGRGILRFIPILGQLYLGWEILTGVLNTVFNFDLEAWLGRQADKIREFLGFARQAQQEVENTTGAGTGTDPATTTPVEVVNPFADQLNQQLQSYRDQTAQLQESLRNQEQLVGLTSEQADYQRTLNEYRRSYNAILDPLLAKESELAAKGAEEADNLRLVREQIAAVRQTYETSLPTVEALAAAVRDKAIAEREAQEALALQEQIQARLLSLSQSQAAFQQSIADRIQAANDELEDLNVSPLERQLRRVGREVDQTFTSRIRQLRAQLQDTTISPQERAQLQRDLEYALSHQSRTRKTLQDIARQNYETQRTFAHGWRKAWEEYAENASNAANQASTVFNKVTKGMEDAIVGFAKTGKFEFKSFIADILETMLRSNIQQVIAQVFTPPQIQAPSLPSGGGGQQGGGGFLGNLISGIGRFFGGFFADGGTLPAGKFGLVGERGPELISGPANITPLNGLGSSVTYNINAVDAASFKQLVARDPEFIHAVATYGGRSIPGRR